MFYPPIYLGMVLILFGCFYATQSQNVRKLAIGALFFIMLCAIGDMIAHGDEVRDRDGRLITRSAKAGAVETVRDASGKILETRATRQGVTTVRDRDGKIIRTERK